MDPNKQKRLLELNLLEFINSFSLLVVVGATSTSFYFSRFFRSDIPPVFYWLLSSTVWVIYTLDHIIDGIRKKDEPLSLRHALHYRYRKTLGAMVAILVPFNIFLAFRFLNDQLLLGGILLACFVFLYLLLVPLLNKLNRWAWKEVLISVGVTGGMCFLPAYAGKLDWHYTYLLLFIVFTLINFLNLVVFSLLDHSEDEQSGMHSIVNILGPESTLEFANQLVILIYLLMGIWMYSFSGIDKIHAAVIFMLMLNILALILLKKEYFRKNNLFRFWGDFIYLVPGLIQVLFIEKLI